MGDNARARNTTLSDFLSDDEIAKCAELKDTTAVREQIIEPNLERINKALGQENDARYLAYAVEHVMRSGGAW